MTLTMLEKIREFEARLRAALPWLVPAPPTS